MLTTSIHFQDKLSLPSLKLSLPEGVGEGELFVNNKALTLAELNGESPCLLSTVEAEKKIEPEAQAASEKVGPEIVEVNQFRRTDAENEIQHVCKSIVSEPRAKSEVTEGSEGSLSKVQDLQAEGLSKVRCV